MSGDAAPVARHPQILWAQRIDRIFLTVDLSDVKNEVVDIKPSSFHFKGMVEVPSSSEYEISFDFYSEVNPEKAIRIDGDRVITYSIMKKEPSSWPRFIKENKKQPWLKVDFNRWKDLDESDDEEAGGFPGGAAGPGGGNFQDMLSMMGNNDFDVDDGNEADADSDDDEIPDLDDPPKAEAEVKPDE